MKTRLNFGKGTFSLEEEPSCKKRDATGRIQCGSTQNQAAKETSLAKPSVSLELRVDNPDTDDVDSRGRSGTRSSFASSSSSTTRRTGRKYGIVAEATLSDIDRLEGSELWSGRQEMTQAMELIATALAMRSCAQCQSVPVRLLAVVLLRPRPLHPSLHTVRSSGG